MDMAIKSSWNGSWSRILPSRVARMVPGPRYGHTEELEWFMDHEMATRVAAMVPGPGYCHQE